MTDYDPRTLAFYDRDNPSGPDHEFYLALADGPGVARIVDLGCGTGLLTARMAAPGREVIGVDPSAAMLDLARSRPEAGAVTWVEGDSRDIPGGGYDLAVMTGNVAQHIPPSDWDRTLKDLRRALRAGGLLAFETRNPAARAWQDWSGQPRVRRRGADGPMVQWMEAVESEPGLVDLTEYTLFEDTGELLREVAQLVFRTREQVEASLREAGFEVRAVYGDWARSPFLGHEALMVFVAEAVRGGQGRY